MPNNCKSPEMCLLTETCVPCAICPNAKEKADDRLALTACSRSLDVFENWEQFCRVKITGYTFRNGTDVMRINFGPSGPSPLSRQAMVDHVRMGFQITAIHYENSELSQPKSVDNHKIP